MKPSSNGNLNMFSVTERFGGRDLPEMYVRDGMTDEVRYRLGQPAVRDDDGLLFPAIYALLKARDRAKVKAWLASNGLELSDVAEVMTRDTVRVLLRREGKIVVSGSGPVFRTVPVTPYPLKCTRPIKSTIQR